MKKYIRNADNTLYLSDLLKRVVCIKFCDDLSREPVKLSESSRIYADESMDDYLPDDNFIMTYNDKQLLNLCSDPDLQYQVESLTKPELLLRIHKLNSDVLTPKQLAIIAQHLSKKVPEVDETGVELLLEKMRKCHNIQYGGDHPDTNLFIIDPDGNIRKEDCLTVIRKLNVSNWDREPLIGQDKAYLGDILVVFQVHADWVDNGGEKFEDLCIYIKIDLNQTTGDSILLVTMHPADRDDNLD